MKIKSLILFLLFTFSAAIQAQIVIEGVVKNEENKNLSYAAIGVKDTEIGAITNTNGYYKITIPKDDAHKKVVIQAEGYNEKTLTAAELKAHPNVYLKFKTKNIQEIMITARKLKDKTIGEKSKPFLTFSKMFDKNVPTIEQGNIFNIYPKTKLKTYDFHIITSSRYEQITLKLNIYSVKNDLPDQSLLQENLIYKTSSTGWQTIDLSPYHLVFNHIDKIAITLQLVDYIPVKEENFVFGISAKKSLASHLMFRRQSQSNWEKSSGNFLTNLQVGYDKKGTDPNKLADDATDETELDKKNEAFNSERKMYSFFKGRAEGEKTIYGKNPQGKYIHLPDAKIYYEEYGSGEPLIFLQGNNGQISDFYAMIPHFAKNYHIIAIDTRGQGKSEDYAKNDYGYEVFADDLLKIINELHLQKVNIIGWSDGGITGLLFNAKNPDRVNKLITMGANLEPNGINDGLLNSIREGFEKSTDPKAKRRLNLMLNHPHIGKTDLESIKNPVLIIAGDEDDVKEEHTKHIAEIIENAELEIIPNATHNIPFDQPTLLNQHIDQFLKGAK